MRGVFHSCEGLLKAGAGSELCHDKPPEESRGEFLWGRVILFLLLPPEVG